MRADIQRKPLGFQELTPPKYRCVAFCVVDLIKPLEVLTLYLVFKTTEVWNNHVAIGCTKASLMSERNFK